MFPWIACYSRHGSLNTSERRQTFWRKCVIVMDREPNCNNPCSILLLFRLTFLMRFYTLLSCVFGRPFFKRFALCYQTVVDCPVLSVLSVCNVRALWPNDLTDQNETWPAVRPRPRPHCVRWGPISSPSQRGTAPNFRLISVAAKWLYRSRCHLVWR